MNEKDNHVIQTFLIQTWNMVGRKVVEEFVTSIHPEEWRMDILYIEKQGIARGICVVRGFIIFLI